VFCHFSVANVTTFPVKSQDDNDEDADIEADEDPMEEAAAVEFARMPTQMKQMILSTADHDPNIDLLHWLPKKIVSSWTDTSGIRHLLVVVPIPTGIKDTDKSGVDVKVTKDGLELCLSEKWDGVGRTTDGGWCAS
jgi:hypothetical protein